MESLMAEWPDGTLRKNPPKQLKGNTQSRSEGMEAIKSGTTSTISEITTRAKEAAQISDKIKEAREFT